MENLEAPNSGSLETNENIPQQYLNEVLSTMENMKGSEKYFMDLERKLYGNPKGGTGKFMSQSKRNKAKKKRKKKSN